MNPLIFLLSGIFAGLPLIGVAREVEVDIPGSALPKTTSLPQKAGVMGAAPNPGSQPLSLEIDLSEINALKLAARQAGGKLVVVYELEGGITTEDLILPLKENFNLEIGPDGLVRVKSKVAGDAIAVEKEKLEELRRQQRQALRNRDFLQSVINAPDHRTDPALPAKTSPPVAR